MSSTGNIQANISGDIKGQVAVGNYILQIGDVNGGVVNVAPPVGGPKYTKRTTPVGLRPRPFPSLLDRDDETATAKSALQAPMPVSVYGPAGIGKTSLLRRLSHLPDLANLPDGIVYLAVTDLGLFDVLQALFDAFFDSQSNFKPSNAEIRLALQNMQALVLLDDLLLDRNEVTSLLDAAPNCTFVLSSVERSIWGEGQPVQVAGLPQPDALALFMRELDEASRSRSRLKSGKYARAWVGIRCALSSLHPWRGRGKRPCQKSCHNYRATRLMMRWYAPR